MNRNYMWIVCAGLVLSSCRPGAQNEASAVPKSTKEEPHKEAVSHWTTKTELFMEYPTLVAGVKGRFAVHFTSLQTFKPQKAGKVEVTLRSKDG